MKNINELLTEANDIVEKIDHLTARQMMKDPNTIILDVRNKYETEIGTFKNSIIPKMNNLTEFPHFVDKELSETKKKKIAMFCTGGIRCEIASSFMMNEGFEEVYQLDGGILRYLKDVQEENLWEGECFVFDERVTVDKLSLIHI